MGMNFHHQQNRITYSSRTADPSWKSAMQQLVSINNVSRAADIGCGGGIYSKALLDMGIPSATAIDFSETILEGAEENCREYDNISFHHGDAYSTGLSSNQFELVLERALIHHLSDLSSCFQEAHRLLKDGGTFIIQDRTPEDCLLPGDESHIRGYIFDLFPRLSTIEMNRRHESKEVLEKLLVNGFTSIQEVQLWETRKTYTNKKQLLQDLRKRTGRSILHELSDQELEVLLNHVGQAISTDGDIIEKDRWTIWTAVK
ncbi:methyltransferase domain-containing protein [Ornithinibacillus sp. L9]|uniref:Methyltransferase domain-containing protein n=1 Tax=Ornithinibacillus caprae TaxID=2678566 RepID=A0A6N8FM86_9BACI|nr:class I SAM-dependent methyltransferase [Ornithinibacillus caprae]MUK89504.1 methyltransferase domain-containing protein [Ornithinibacillus caprae]